MATEHCDHETLYPDDQPCPGCDERWNSLIDELVELAGGRSNLIAIIEAMKEQRAEEQKEKECPT